ncbi:MAG: hypothetical protein V3V04_05750 [Rhizobiaceae bacterium]
MTDYRDLNHPGLHPSRADAYRTSHESGTSIGGILIALALVGLLFLTLSLVFGGSGDTTISPSAVAPASSDTSKATRTVPVPVKPAPATN